MVYASGFCGVQKVNLKLNPSLPDYNYAHLCKKAVTYAYCLADILKPKSTCKGSGLLIS
jgi:hypothetical protein